MRLFKVVGLASVFLFAVLTCSGQQDKYNADVIVYGGTSAAVISAVQVAKMGKTVLIVSPDIHLGGLSSGGLGWTDTGDKTAIGGLSREFYHRIWKHYQKDESWKWQTREQYGEIGIGSREADGDKRTQWTFEPHVAEQVFEDFIEENKITVVRDEWLDRAKGVELVNGGIKSIMTISGKKFTAKIFIDATYEGDLMAAAGVSYHVGREANSVYGETWNGIQTGVLHHDHWFKNDISPYNVPGDPSSGVLPLVSTEDPGVKGEGDKRVQAYCFRLCMTNHPENRVPFPKPENYDPARYELLSRVFASGWREQFEKFDPVPNRKTDTNNHGPVSSDYIGMNYDYPEASYDRRREIITDHENYQKGLLYFMANDSSVPEEVRNAMNEWGLAKDEFVDNGNWPHQLYIREARRMIGEYVTTEHDIIGSKDTPQAVGMGSYTMDSHNVQRYIKDDGFVQNEGDIGARVKKPYKISYGSLIPKKEECKNLLVPVAVSSSHIAYGSIRMEPVFMILGQSAGTAAALAIEKDIGIHDLSYDDLKARLVQDGQILDSAGFSKSTTTKFTYQNITGIGQDSLYNRRDNSDIIKVGDTYYVWYSRMDSPTTAGYWATVWYATSKDEGRTWVEKGMALDVGNEGQFDSHSVFTPNILAYQGKYYLYYTGVQPTPGKANKEFENNSTSDFTAIGVAVAVSPDGPFERVDNNPVLEVSVDAEAFDSYRIDDASMLVKDEKIGLYYKGRSLSHGKKGPGLTEMGVAFADSPEGPFVKHEGALLDKSHEVLIWGRDNGVASLASISSSINFAPDGLHFSPIEKNLKDIPKAPGLYRPHLENGNTAHEIPGWGIAMVQKKGLAYLVRYEMK